MDDAGTALEMTPELRKVAGWIASWVSDHYLAWDEPLALRVVNARWGRLLRYRHGELAHALLEWMAREGMVRLVLVRGGATMVWPPAGKVLTPSGVYSNGKRPE